MGAWLIVIRLFLLAVIVMGIRYDRRQRRMRLESGRPTSGRLRLDNQTRADKWGAP